jgi:hypothetical protein
VVVIGEKGEGKGNWQGGLGLLLSPLMPTRVRQGVDLDQDFLLAAKRMAGQVSLVGLFEKREEKRERLES